jgi:hypothetical protein
VGIFYPVNPEKSLQPGKYYPLSGDPVEATMLILTAIIRIAFLFSF